MRVCFFLLTNYLEIITMLTVSIKFAKQRYRKRERGIMTKVKKNKPTVKMAPIVVGDGGVAAIKLVPPSRYKMIPVDQHTHARLMALCSEYGFGQRGQGAMVRKLVNSEFEKILSTLPASKL